MFDYTRILVSILYRPYILHMPYMFCLYMAGWFCLLYLFCLPMPVWAAAWLQEKGALELTVSHRSSHLTIYEQNTGLAIPYGRREIELYSEYGLNRDITLTSKWITGRNGRGLPSEQDRGQFGELGIRVDADWAQTNLLPFGTQTVWQAFDSDKKIRRIHRAAFETGLNFNGQRSDDIGWRGLFAIADKIETHSVKPLHLYIEFMSEGVFWLNGDNNIKLISRMELGYSQWYLAYERVDGRLHSFHNYYEHLWLWEIGIPLISEHNLQLKWAHDRTRYGVPREDRFTIGFRFRFPPKK